MGLEALLIVAGIVLLIVGVHTLGWILLIVGLVILAIQLILVFALGRASFGVWRHFRRRRTGPPAGPTAV